MKTIRIFVVAMILALLTGGLANAAPKTTVRWSDPVTWGGKVPVEGAAVTIPKGKTILLDVSPPPLGSLRIDGALIFDERDLELQTDWILIHGLLQVGTESKPFRHQAAITLLDRTPGEDVHGMGDKVIGVMDGRIELHGTVRGPSWTRLATTAAAGANQLVLERPVAWRPGDRLVVASTDFDAHQAEEVVVAGVEENVVTLADALVFPHWGDDQSYGGRVLRERAEVGLLSRNIVVRGDAASEAKGVGGHLMVMGGTARIEGAEFTRMGQNAQQARYPIHFHLLGDRPDAFVRNTSIHHTFNRCLTIHGTNRVTVSDNVAFDAIGHCYFLEDGIETGNRLTGNLGLLTRAPAMGEALLPSDALPATFWITNPDNLVRGNTAAGSDGTGFWYALPEHPTGLSDTAANRRTVWPRRAPLLEFSGNVAHSNGFRGLDVDNGPKPDGTTEVFSYNPRLDPVPPGGDAAIEDEHDTPAVTAAFTDFTAYKNRERGAWFDGKNIRLVNAVLADNLIGATLAVGPGFVEDSLIVGESANAGTPMPWMPEATLRGYEYYGGPVGLRNVAFAGFFPNAQRPASALGFVPFNPFPFDPGNHAAGLIWLDDSTRIAFEDALPDYDGNKTNLLIDQSGSITGVAGAAIVPNQPLLLDDSCNSVQPWNASVCQGQYLQLLLQNFAEPSGSIGPVVLGRTDGAELTLAGVPDEAMPGPARIFHAALIAKTGYTLEFQNVPDRLRFLMVGKAQGDWIRLSIPYTGERPSIYLIDAHVAEYAFRQVKSLEDLEASDGMAFFYDGETLDLKLQTFPGLTFTGVDVCRVAGCA